MLQYVNTYLALYMIFHLNGNTHYFIFNNRVLSVVIIPLKLTNLYCASIIFSVIFYGMGLVELV